MTREEYEVELNRVNKKMDEVIDASMLMNKNDRTLLYGYTCDRLTWHVYIKDGVIHKVLYGTSWDRDGEMPVTEYEVKYNCDYIPNKRIYPECCDLEFCTLLAQRCIHLPFTCYEDEREKKQFYGKIL